MLAAVHSNKLAHGNEGGGTRTHDLGIKSPLLYQLSYAPLLQPKIMERVALRTIALPTMQRFPTIYACSCPAAQPPGLCSTLSS